MNIARMIYLSLCVFSLFLPKYRIEVYERGSVEVSDAAEQLAALCNRIGVESMNSGKMEDIWGVGRVASNCCGI